MVLVDLMLPDYNGFEAVHALRLTAPSSALIAFNADSDEALLLEALSAGAYETVSIFEDHKDGAHYQTGPAEAFNFYSCMRYSTLHRRTSMACCIVFNWAGVNSW